MPLVTFNILHLLLILILLPNPLAGQSSNRLSIIRGDSIHKNVSLIFSGDEYGEGLSSIRKTLKKEQIPASFFLTGRFYRTKSFLKRIKKLHHQGHYFGPHSDQHLLYCDWVKRDSLLVSKNEFETDLIANYRIMDSLGIKQSKKYFLPPYEWYNDSIIHWSATMGVQLINFTPGTLSHTDYTTLFDKNYRSNEMIYKSIIDYEFKNQSGLNGFILLVHVGAGPNRKEKFYQRLPGLINYLKNKGYLFVRIDELVKDMPE